MESTEEQYQLPLILLAVPASHAWVRPSWTSDTKVMAHKVMSLAKGFIMTTDTAKSLNSECYTGLLFCYTVLLLVRSDKARRVGVMANHD